MLKRVKFIYNPSSGENTVTDNLDEIIELYLEHGYSIVPYRLTFKRDPAEIIYDLDRTYHHILIAGGDGTVNFIVNLLKNNDIDIPVAVLPTGTANDFATILGVPGNNIMDSCKTILKSDIVPVDVGRANGQYFVNVFSCGLFTDISQKTPTIMKNTFGKLAYYVGGLGELSRFRRMHIDIKSDGGDFEGDCIIFFVFNGRTAGNLKIAYLSEIDDGLLDVLIVKGESPIQTIQTLIHYLPLSGKHTSYPPGIEHIRCSHLTASCDTDENTDIDGQPGPGFPLEITCENGGLRVLKPKESPKKRKRQRQTGYKTAK